MADQRESGRDTHSQKNVRGIYVEHRAKLRSFIAGFTGGDGDADDIVQDAFVRLIFTMQNVTVENPVSFLYVTARNIAIDRARNRTRRLAVEIGGYDEEALCAVALHGEAGLDARIQLGELSETIRRFPAKSRNLFVRRKLLGESYKDISNDTQIAVSTIEKHIANCVLACRQAVL